MFSNKSRNSLVSKRPSPKFGCVSFGDSEVVALKQAVGKYGFELCEHVTEDQGQLGEVPPEEEREPSQLQVEVGQLQRPEAGRFNHH